MAPRDGPRRPVGSREHDAAREAPAAPAGRALARLRGRAAPSTRRAPEGAESLPGLLTALPSRGGALHMQRSPSPHSWHKAC